MSQTFLYECSHNNSNTAISNSNWTNVFGKGIQIEEGDEISIKTAFINTIEQQFDESILITEDEEKITLKVGYYEYNYINTDDMKKTHDGGGIFPIDYKPYIMYNSISTGNDYMKYESFNMDVQVIGINAGLYKNIFENFIITVNYTNFEDRLIVGEKRKITNANIIVEKDIPAPGPGNATSIKLVSYDNPIVYKVSGGTPLITKIECTKTEKTNIYETNYNLVANSQVISDADLEGSLSTNNVSLYLPKGKYSRAEIAKLLTEQMTSAQYMDGQTHFSTGNYFLPKINSKNHFYPIGTAPKKDGSSTSYYNYVIPANKDVLIGASQAILNYDDDTQNFTFSYLHSPIFNQKIQSIYQAYSAGTPPSYYSIPQQCGCFLVGLYPESFWYDKLKFDKDKVLMAFVAPTATELGYIKDIGEFDKKITKGFLSLQTTMNDGDRIIDASGASYYTSTNNLTISIDGENIPANDPAVAQGYYLIDCGLPSNGYYNKEKFMNVQAIVSKQYSNNSFITGYNDSSVHYIHRGEPFVFKSANIRILDGSKDHKEADDIDENSSVFIQIIKSIDNINKKNE